MKNRPIYIELRNLPSSFLRLEGVSRRVIEHQLHFLTVLKLGCISNTEWSDNPKGGKVLTKSWSYKLGMFVIIRSSVWSPLVGQPTSCLSLNWARRRLMFKWLKSPVSKMWATSGITSFDCSQTVQHRLIALHLQGGRYVRRFQL